MPIPVAVKNSLHLAAASRDSPRPSVVVPEDAVEPLLAPHLARLGPIKRPPGRLRRTASARLRLLLRLQAVIVRAKSKALRSIPRYLALRYPHCCFSIAVGCSTLARWRATTAFHRTCQSCSAEED